jgi:arginyl-tRNA synthetase
MIFNIEESLKNYVLIAVNELYNIKIENKLIQIQDTSKEFEGDYTIVVFPLVKILKKSPDIIGNELGTYLLNKSGLVKKYNVIKGFLNLLIFEKKWIDILSSLSLSDNFGFNQAESPLTYMIEYSSPNTNKPLHLGHIRNNLLGFSLSRILEAYGHKVIKVNLVNDRGIHICKTMLAWQKWANGDTPEKLNVKGDHFVGDYYVKFETEFKKQIHELVKNGVSEDEALRTAPIIKEAQKLLQQWEKGDESVIELWKMMNSWVYEGFDETYKKLGVEFDKIYYESETFLLGKEKVLEGAEKGIFYKKDDGSIWVDLTNDGLDHKLLLRNDGTTVYITQDIGTAIERVKDYYFDEMIYVVGNEQEYHFQVLSLILDKLGFKWAKNLKHLSYGMVELPTGKMKSREGTVVDADDLIDEMISTACKMSEQLGKLDEFSEKEKEEIFRIIGLGALKYFILKVDPKKNMTFDPAESIDFNGNTGPFIQYTYARIQSLLKKAEDKQIKININMNPDISVTQKEIELIKLLYKFPEAIRNASNSLNPSLIANYCFELAKTYNQFYHDYQIIKEPDERLRNFRLLLSDKTGKVIKKAMFLLGIEVPVRM